MVRECKAGEDRRRAVDREGADREDPTMLTHRIPASGQRRGAVRGVTLLAILVFVGLGSGAGFYRWQRARQAERFQRDLETVPEGPEERLDLWLRLAGPQLHHRLAVVGRFTPEEPWLVTHAVARPGEVPELFGLRCAELTPAFARREGLVVVLELPAPHALGRTELSGDRAQRVPIFAPEVAVDGAARLRTLALHLLEEMPAALARDLPGATLEVRVAGG